MQYELEPFALPEGYGEGILSIASLKEHLSVLHDDDDVLISAYRDAAVDMVERYCGIRLGACENVVWKAESLASHVKLGAWPVTDINSVSWLDNEGATITGDATIWRIVRRDEIALKPGAVMPTGVAAGVEINFDCGFGDTNRPAALVQAARFFVAHLYRHREGVLTGTISGELPLGFRELCSRYRMPVI